MELLSTGWHAVSAFLVFTVGLIFSLNLGRYFAIGHRRSCFLYLWHTLFCSVYCVYVIDNGGDALSYYRQALNGFVDFGVGTPAVVNINALFASYLGFSLLGSFLINNIFGYIGLLAFYASLCAAVSQKRLFIKRMAFVVVLLPSVSFWSSALGKDSISFLATGLVLWASLNIKNRVLLLWLAIFLMFLVRPHMAGLLIVAFAIAHVVDTNGTLLSRFLLGSLSVIATAFMVPFALKYAGVEGGGAESITAYVDGRQSVNLHGGGSVDIANMSAPMQLFTYLFRPLPFEASNLFQLAASLDNVLLLGLFVVGGCAMFKGKKSSLNEHRMFLWSYTILAWVVLSVTTANLGISMRQKWMFAPILIFLLISVVGKGSKATMIHPRSCDTSSGADKTRL